MSGEGCDESCDICTNTKYEQVFYKRGESEEVREAKEETGTRRFPVKGEAKRYKSRTLNYEREPNKGQRPRKSSKQFQ